MLSATATAIQITVGCKSNSTEVIDIIVCDYFQFFWLLYNTSEDTASCSVLCLCRDKAGGYGIQAVGGTLVKAIHGDYYNVVGFPVNMFARRLTKHLQDGLV